MKILEHARRRAGSPRGRPGRAPAARPGGAKPLDRQRGAGAVAEHREAAGRVGIAAEPAERAPADAGGVARLDDRVARGADGEGISRQGERGTAARAGRACARASTSALARFARALSIDAAMAMIPSGSRPTLRMIEHLQAGGKPRPARSDPVLHVAVQEGASVIAARRLAELPQQIEHFRRDVLIERVVVDRSQRVADVARSTRAAASEASVRSAAASCRWNQ